MSTDPGFKYYHILGLAPGAGIDSIKKAYRQKARLFHPDMNHSPGAADQFILINEAYEYLLALLHNKGTQRVNFDYAWEERHRNEAKERAARWSAHSYKEFTSTSTYKSSQIFDIISLIMAFSVSFTIMGMSLYGYFFNLAHSRNDLDKPSVMVLIISLITGVLFLSISLLYLKSYISIQRTIKKKYAKNK